MTGPIHRMHPSRALALSVDGNLPSPHGEQYSWVMNRPKDRHFAATLTWDAGDGVLLGIGFRQAYE